MTRYKKPRTKKVRNRFKLLKKRVAELEEENFILNEELESCNIEISELKELSQQKRSFVKDMKTEITAMGYGAFPEFSKAIQDAANSAKAAVNGFTINYADVEKRVHEFHESQMQFLPVYSPEEVVRMMAKAVPLPKYEFPPFPPSHPPCRSALPYPYNGGSPFPETTEIFLDPDGLPVTIIRPTQDNKMYETYTCEDGTTKAKPLSDPTPDPATKPDFKEIAKANAFEVLSQLSIKINKALTFRFLDSINKYSSKQSRPTQGEDK
jgi:hypothetical protein